tara:strand:- start:174 stop:674 length:501 start_codon:yes stop_codon:yes gene_type:complete
MDDTKCISECYFEGIYIHPLYLTSENIESSFCLADPEGGNTNINYIKKCNKPTENYKLNIASIDYNKYFFLENIYKINNWNTLNKYVKSNIQEININTIDRLLKYSWELFHKDYKVNVDYIIDIYRSYCEKFFKEKKININKMIYSLGKLKNDEYFDYINNYIKNI